MKRVAIIGNKHAGRGIASQTLSNARRTLWGWPCDFIFPSSAEDLVKTCAGLDPEKYEAAIAIGGDGTVNTALRGLMKSNVPLYPFPGGTANDLARELNIQSDWSQVQRLLDSRRTSRMDLIDVNGIPFATVAGVGLGARLTSEFNSRRKSSVVFKWLATRLKSEVYTALSAKAVLSAWDHGRYLQIKAGNFDERVRTAAVFICNQSKLGGDFTVAPPLDNTDKKFNVLIIPRTGAAGMLRALVSLKRGHMPEDFITFSTDAVTLKDLRGKPIEVFGDGDILTRKSRLDFRILPGALNVYREQERRKSAR